MDEIIPGAGTGNLAMLPHWRRSTRGHVAGGASAPRDRRRTRIGADRPWGRNRKKFGPMTPVPSAAHREPGQVVLDGSRGEGAVRISGRLSRSPS